MINRRSFVRSSGAAMIASSTLYRSVESQSPQSEPLDVIDCHTHFYDPSRPQGVPWPAQGTKLYRTVLPEHLRSLKQYHPVTGTVIVEASSWVEDNAWLLELAKEDPFIVGIVGRLDPESSDFAKQVGRFSDNELFCGIRISSQQLQKLESQSELGKLSPLSEQGLALDVNGGPDTPATIAKAAKQLPDLRFILNHIGNVEVSSSPPPSEWRKGVELAAANANVYCKISALVEGAARNGRTAPDDVEFYKPYIDVVWNAFGEDRVIYGSNWPVSESAADYYKLQKIVALYVADKGDQATRKFFSRNASAAYRWIERPGRRE
jgi:predicted TIM-barrel fold metal-dependent hydrolase